MRLIEQAEPTCDTQRCLVPGEAGEKLDVPLCHEARTVLRRPVRPPLQRFLHTPDHRSLGATRPSRSTATKTMVDVTSQEFQAAIATAAFAAATAATSSMAAPQNTPQGAWAHQGYPAHLQPQAHNPYTMQPMMRQLPTSAPRGSESQPRASDDGAPSGDAPPADAALHASFQLLVQQHAAELEARRKVEAELQELRGKYDELQAAYHKADVDKCVAVANAKSAEKTVKEKEASIGRLEEQVRPEFPSVLVSVVRDAFACPFPGMRVSR